VLSEAQLDAADVVLIRRIRFDPDLEVEGLRRLSELDVDGCRTAFGQLVDRLALEGLDGSGREAVLLLFDVLQKVAARVHRASSDGDAYLHARAALARSFAAIHDPEEARAAFLPALHRLLAPLRRPADGAHTLVERAKLLIEESYGGRLSLSAVAARLHVSPNYLSRLFRSQTGRTLTEFVHRTRLEHARMLLAEGDRSISEIAYLVGYQNYRDFYRNFIKYENASPRQVQRRGLATGRPLRAAVAEGDA
jgi:AraC-like DNA-binding protein